MRRNRTCLKKHTLGAKFCQYAYIQESLKLIYGCFVYMLILIYLLEFVWL